MNFRKSFWFVSSIIFALVLVACDNNASEAAVVELTPAQQTLPQSATFDGGQVGGAFTMNFPEGWTAQVDETDIKLTNNADILGEQDPNATLPSGAVLFSVSVTPADQTAALGDNVTPTLFVQSYLDLLAGLAEFGDIETMTIGEHDGAKATGTMSSSDSIIFALDLGGNFVVGVGIAPEGELAAHTDTINAIMASVTLSS